MRRRCSCCSQVAVGFILLTPALLAQHSGHAGPVAEPHASGGAHFSAPPIFTPPPAPGLRSHLQHPAKHPDERRRGANSGHLPYVYGPGPGPISVGYGYPFAYGLANGGQGISDEDNVSAAPASGAPDNAAGAEPSGEAGPSGDAEAPQNQQFAQSAPPVFRPYYQGSAAIAPVMTPVKAQPATRLIFKDGRAPQLVHNYVLTSATLYALDGDTRQEIPLSLLDVPATVATNGAVGVDFALPVSR